MKSKKITRTVLAAEVGLTQGGITRLFNGEQKSSAWVPAINKALGLPAPDDALPDEVVELARALGEADREKVISYIKWLRSQRDSEE